MFMPAVRLGLHYYGRGLERYVSRIGLDNAKRLFLTAEKIGPDEMNTIGILTHLVEPEALGDVDAAYVARETLLGHTAMDCGCSSNAVVAFSLIASNGGDLKFSAEQCRMRVGRPPSTSLTSPTWPKRASGASSCTSVFHG